jgi:hypothetical protein
MDQAGDPGRRATLAASFIVFTRTGPGGGRYSPSIPSCSASDWVDRRRHTARRAHVLFSARIRPEWVREREWGIDSTVYTARVIGDFLDLADDALIPYSQLSEAENRESRRAVRDVDGV